jgi:hypothetical protein
MRKKFNPFHSFLKLKTSIHLFAAFLILGASFLATNSFGQPAPPYPRVFTTTPTTLRIDGFLQRQLSDTGDWLEGAVGSGFSGNNALDSMPPLGSSIRPLAFHYIDAVDDQDNIFDGSNTATQNPTMDWTWKVGSALDKANINHALLYLAKDNTDSSWGIFSADRQTANGTTAIDFEFLQKTLTKNDDHTFTSSAPNSTGGRTVGDILVTVKFQGNISTAPVIIFYRWALVGSTYTYQEFMPPNNEAFVAVNSGEIRVPYGAFGNYTYGTNTFIEGAVNLTKLITTAGGECAGANFKTLFIKTKSTDGIDGNMKDFLEPQQINISIGSTSITYNNGDPICADASPVDVTFGENPVTTEGTFSATPDGLDIDGDGKITPANSAVGTYTVTFAYSASDDCPKTATAEVTIQNCCDNVPPVFTGDYTTVPLGCNPSTAAINTALGSATASDAGDNASVEPVATDGDVQSNGCSRSLTRTFTATDKCSNTSTASRTVTWTEDHTKPVITLANEGDPSALGCNPNTDVVNAALGTASASDGCGLGSNTIQTSTADVVSSGCGRSQTRTWTVTDACSNTASASRTVTWTFDQTNPVITVAKAGDPTALGCNPSTDAVNAALGTASASDGCGLGSNTIQVSTGNVISDGCGRSQTRTWTVTDACSNTASASRTVTWTFDQTNPVITVAKEGDPTALGCNPSTDVVNAALGTASASDGCGLGSNTIQVSTGNVISDGCGRSQTRIWTVTDACSNTASASRTVTWTFDQTNPVITVAKEDDPTALGCNPSTDVVNAALGTASASDGCGLGSNTIQVSTGNVISDGCGRSQTRTWTVTDACSNTASASRTVTWTFDQTNPVITVAKAGDPSALGCNPSTDVINAALGTASASDGCGLGSNTIQVSTGNVITDGCGRSQTRTWTVTDACSNTASASRTVTWTFDQTNPVITVAKAGDPSTLGCNPSTDAINTALGTASASDGCGLGSNTIQTSTADVVSIGCGRSQTRTWTVTDACSNTASASRTVTWTFDQTNPVITVAKEDDPTALGCNPSTDVVNAALGTASASDGCGLGSNTIQVSTGNVITDGCGRSQTRTWTVTDACSNTASASRTVTWTFDQTNPVITVAKAGDPSALGCNPSTDAINTALGTASASDGCGLGSNTIQTSTADVVSIGCGRSQTRTWTVTDACSNTASASRTVTWTFDETRPVITVAKAGDPTALGCNPSTDVINTALGTASASDGCGLGSNTIQVSTANVVSDGCGRSQTRTWTVTDACSNTASASRTVTWTFDQTRPVITVAKAGDPTALGCNPSTDVIDAALGAASASDGCGLGSNTIQTSTAEVVSSGCGRSQTRTWTVTDACSNTASVSRTVTWTFDQTRPVITVAKAGDATALGCNPTTDAINSALGTASASDGCGLGSNTIQVSTANVVSDGCGRSQTRTWTVTDACSNTASASRTVTWTFDKTPPTITGTGTTLTLLNCNPSTADIEAALGTASATDACSTPTVSSTDGLVIGTNNCKSQTRTWRATDGCGNTATTSRTVRWSVSQTTDDCWTATLIGVIQSGGNTTYKFQVCAGNCPFDLSNIAFIVDKRIRVISPTNGSTYNFPGDPNFNYNVVTPVAKNIGGVKFEIGSAGFKNNICDIFEFTVSGGPTQVTIQIKAGNKTSQIIVDANCPCTQQSSTITSARVISETGSTATVTAYPNPYNDQVKFNILSPVSGRAVLEAYDLLGRKIAVVYQGSVQAGVVRTVEYRIPAIHRVAMIYTLRIGDHVINGKLFPNGGIHY